jgi:phosphate transport system substrate-binding protein
VFDLDETQCGLTASGKKSSLASLNDGTSDLILFEGDSSDIPDGAAGAPVAFEAVAVIVNPSCGVTDLSAAQLTAIFSGEQTNWSSLGGSGEVTLVVPEASDSFRQTFEELFSLRASVNGIMKSVIPSSAVLSAQVVQDVAATPGAVGICPAALLENGDMVVAIGGVSPTSEALKNGTYPAARTMMLVLRQGASEAAGDFYTYCTSQAAASVISASGYIPY